MKNQLFEDLIESIKELPTEILEEMKLNLKVEEVRAQFEKVYPIPSGVAWNEGTRQYVLFHQKWCTLDCHSAYCAKWTAFKEGWQASRESLVVELPISEIYDSRSGSLNGIEEVIYPEDKQQVLESQGIKWK